MNDLLKTLAAVFVLILADTVIQTIYDIREEREQYAEDEKKDVP